MSDYEKQLLKSAKNGGVSAFEELTTSHQVVVYNFMLRECGDEFIASQLTQEVFVKVFALLTTNKCTNNFYASIYRTASEVSRKAVCESKQTSQINDSAYVSI